MKLTTALFSGVAAMALALPAGAETLRIQTHYAPETTSGKLAQEFVDQVAADFERRHHHRDVLFVVGRENGRNL